MSGTDNLTGTAQTPRTPATAQAVTRRADQWRGGDAVGHLSHVGGGKDGVNGGSQIAR